jgi:hypothetical protein
MGANQTAAAKAAVADNPNFQKSTAGLSCSPTPQDLKFEREDWALFRTVEGNSVTRDQATDLLLAARAIARPVKAERLGAVGPDMFPDYAYARSSGVARFGSVAPRAEVPVGTYWEEWLQTHRVELNAMTTPQFIEWLDGKMAAYDKLIPPPEVLETGLNERIETKVREAVTAHILRKANVDAQVAAALADIETPDSTALAKGIDQLFDERPDAEWRDHIESVAIDCTRAADDDAGGES